MPAQLPAPVDRSVRTLWPYRRVAFLYVRLNGSLILAFCLPSPLLPDFTAGRFLLEFFERYAAVLPYQKGLLPIFSCRGFAEQLAFIIINRIRIAPHGLLLLILAVTIL